MSTATVTIGTHNGHFHCDEALACYMLRCLDRFAEAPIVRSRDPAVHKQQTILVDVGDVYDPSIERFDHHQKGFFETFSASHRTKLSSAGLIYKHYGREVIAAITSSSLSSADLDTVFVKVYENFVEGIDGIDNGIGQYRCTGSDACTPASLQALYRIGTDVSARVGHLNPAWNEPCTPADVDERFALAMQLVGGEFAAQVRSLASSWLPARQLVEVAIGARFEHDPSGQVVVLARSCPWKEHLLRLEQDLALARPILYVLYADDANATWRVQCVPATPTSFESRLPLPEPWRGLRDQALTDATGIAGCVFVHNAGFIGGNRTFDNALAMATRAIAMQQ